MIAKFRQLGNVGLQEQVLAAYYAVVKKLIAIISITVFSLSAALWIVQCYRPIIVQNTFSSDTFAIRPVTPGLEFCEYDKSTVQGVGLTTMRDGAYILKVLKKSVDLLPEEGEHRLIEFADGRFHIRDGVTDVAPAGPRDSGRYANRRFKITTQRSYPLWPLLLIFGTITAGIVLRWASRRRLWMLETYRASVPHKRQVVFVFLLLVSSSTLYLAQLRGPLVLYNGFATKSGKLGLKRNLNWDRQAIMKNCKAIGTDGSRPNVITISVLPDELETLLPPLGEHWVLVIGADAFQWRSGTVSTSNVSANPAWKARHVSAPLTVRFSLPLWLCMLGSGVWLIYMTIVPSRQYLKRKRRGLCLKCGYDLRATRDRCPECGEALPKGQ